MSKRSSLGPAIGQTRRGRGEQRDRARLSYECFGRGPESTSGPSSGYAGRIKARIKPNIVLTAALDGNPSATVEVRVAPDGTIVGRKLIQSSGSPAWDETVLRAIDKTEVLPKDVDGRVPPTITIAFRPLE